MPVPADVVCCWPSTAASIPAGWSRDSRFDSKFIQGAPAAGDADFTARGNANHTHTSGAHTPTQQAHTHSFSAGTSGDTQTNKSGILTARAHSHASLTSNSATATNQSSTVSFDANSSNDPPFVKVIFIKSDGTPAGIPMGAYAFFESDTLPGGWERRQGNTYLKGADAGEGGSGTGGAATHTHLSAAHTHLQNAHSHAAKASAASSGACGDMSADFPEDQTADCPHRHNVSLLSATATNQSTQNTAAAANHEPVFKKLNIIENTGAAALPANVVALWGGAAASIPSGWARYTPMDGYFLKGANADGEALVTGGSQTHTHTATCQPTQNAHNHSPSVSTIECTSADNLSEPGGINRFVVCSHSHSWTIGSTAAVNNALNYSVNANASESAYPPYVRPIFIRFTGAVAVPSPPDIFRRRLPRPTARRRAVSADPVQHGAAYQDHLDRRPRRRPFVRRVPYDPGPPPAFARAETPDHPGALAQQVAAAVARRDARMALYARRLVLWSHVPPAPEILGTPDQSAWLILPRALAKARRTTAARMYRAALLRTSFSPAPEVLGAPDQSLRLDRARLALRAGRQMRARAYRAAVLRTSFTAAPEIVGTPDQSLRLDRAWLAARAARRARAGIYRGALLRTSFSPAPEVLGTPDQSAFLDRPRALARTARRRAASRFRAAALRTSFTPAPEILGTPDQSVVLPRVVAAVRMRRDRYRVRVRRLGVETSFAPAPERIGAPDHPGALAREFVHAARSRLLRRALWDRRVVARPGIMPAPRLAESPDWSWPGREIVHAARRAQFRGSQLRATLFRSLGSGPEAPVAPIPKPGRREISEYVKHRLFTRHGIRLGGFRP